MKCFLTETRAALRASSIFSGIQYNVFLHLKKGSEYSGLGHYEFSVKDSKNVFLDFSGKEISFLRINDFTVSKKHIGEMWQEGSVNLPGEHLLNGSNTLIIGFKNDYHKDGNGLHSCVDTDGLQYIYTQTEPFWMNRIIPLFDQPDLKGRLSLETIVPKDWVFITSTSAETECSSKHFFNGNPRSVLQELIFQEYSYGLSEEDLIYYKQKQSPLLSSYLYGFAAGPFKEIKLPEPECLPGISMSIHTRESLFKYAQGQTKELFNYGIEGIKFYSEFFNYKFPFEKFDFVFCPEYTVGAMEYPGAVTYNDLYVFREKASAVRVTRRGETIVHELAHFWFGDLVTMKWWNDLWLNESFADFVCFLCNHHISAKLTFETVDSWTSFKLNKFWGYNEDQSATTHPIAGEVESTEKADSIFDGITYSKGAAVMKQMYYILGHEKFSTNIGNYFRKYQWSNATLSDFIEEMNRPLPGEQHPIDLKKWQVEWISKAGLNQLEVQWDHQQRGPSQLKLRQTAVLPQHPTLREHKLRIAFYNPDGTVGEVKDVLLLPGELTTMDFDNKGYAAVLPNYEDWAYIKIRLDDRSRDFFMDHIEKVESPLSRLLVVRSLFEMVRDANLRSDKFVQFISSKYLPFALSNLQLFTSIMDLVQEAISRYTPYLLVKDLRSSIFGSLSQMLATCVESAQTQALLKKMIAFASTDKDISQLVAVFEEHLGVENGILGVADLWSIVFKVQGSKTLASDLKESVFQRMEARDQSDLMKETKLSIDSMTASDTQRESLWSEYIDSSRKMNYTDFDSSISGFFSSFVEDKVRETYYQRYFEELLSVLMRESKEPGTSFLLNGKPVFDLVDLYIEEYRRVVGKLTEKQLYFSITINKIIDGLERKKKALSLYK